MAEPELGEATIDMEKKKPLIDSVEIFRDISPACTVAIVQCLTPLFVPPREYVTIESQMSDCMYFINRGVVQLTKFEKRGGADGDFQAKLRPLTGPWKPPSSNPLPNHPPTARPPYTRQTTQSAPVYD